MSGAILLLLFNYYSVQIPMPTMDACVSHATKIRTHFDGDRVFCLDMSKDGK